MWKVTWSRCCNLQHSSLNQSDFWQWLNWSPLEKNLVYCSSTVRWQTVTPTGLNVQLQVRLSTLWFWNSKFRQICGFNMLFIESLLSREKPQYEKLNQSKLQTSNLTYIFCSHNKCRYKGNINEWKNGQELLLAQLHVNHNVYFPRLCGMRRWMARDSPLHHQSCWTEA